MSYDSTYITEKLIVRGLKPTVMSSQATRGPRHQRRKTDNRKEWLESRKRTSVQIRKQRKESILRQKRHLPSGAIEAQTQDLELGIKQFLQDPSLIHLQRINESLSVSNAQEIFESLLDSKHHESDRFLQSLLQFLPQALQLLLNLSTLSSKTQESYYGKQKPGWAEKILYTEELLNRLVEMVPTNDVASHILGNLVLEEPSLASSVVVIPFWGRFLSMLPKSSFPVAAIIRVDQTTYGRTLLEGFPTEVLRGPTVEVSWILEGLTRREDEVIDILCSDQDLVESMVQRMASRDLEVLFPLLRAISNILVRCDGRHMSRFLVHQSFVPNIRRIIEDMVTHEVITVISCCLYDLEIDDRPVVNDFMLMLVNLLCSDVYNLEWRKEALHAISIATESIDTTSRAGLGTIEKYLVHEQMARLLVDFLSIEDTDLVLDALYVIGALLPKFPSIVRYFEQEGIKEKLDCLCDHQNQEVVEAAVVILDDFFDLDDTADLVVVPNSHENSLQFGMSPGLDLHVDGPRGRGRGKTMPAWMLKNEN